ncbi:hypothetical protein M422DRAFT_23635 [Sphaerobolus stellatus SS14]|nr:hypothetical protein M422DRAFT_23635 [Sphaerobolus stellatus SS14]
MSSSAKPTLQEEDDFMKNLLDGIDESFFDAVPSSPIHESVSKSRSVTSKDASSRIEVSRRSREVQLEILDNREKGENTKKSTISVAVEDVDMSALCEGADAWDWGEMDLEEEKSAQQPKRQIPQYPTAPPLVRSKCTRCEVIELSTKGCSEKRLTVRVDISDAVDVREVILVQDWVQTDVVAGDIINVLGEFTPCSDPSSSTQRCRSTITVSSKENMLILHPDLLLSATTIANTPTCSRKPIVSLMLASNAPAPANSTEDAPVRGSPGEVVVWGNFLHEVMQKCLSAGTWDKKSIEENIENIVRSPAGLRELVKLGVGIEKARFEVRARSGGLQMFANRFISSTIQPDGKLTDPRETSESRSKIAITALYDVEEDIWSPTYGIKGKLDASVQVLIQEELLAIRKAFGEQVTREWSLPFEIKTGRAVGVLEHRAQTMLYTLVMAERYGVEVPSGLLYYTQSDELMRVPAARNEVKALLMGRNDLASYLMRKRVIDSADGVTGVLGERPLLPPTLDDDYKCTKCYAVNGCMLYRKTVENIEDTTSPIAELYEKKTAHLTPAQCAFFKKWEALVSMEEQDVVRFRKELWTLTAEEREQKGRCFARMIVLDYKHDDTPGAARMQHVYRFVRASDASAFLGSVSTQLPDGSASLLNGSMSAGDAITISLEPDLIAVARGFVIDLEPDFMTIGFDHRIDLRAILARTRPHQPLPGTIVCRIDKDEFGSGLGRIRDNLARLFYVNGDTKRLSLVVDLAPPQFDDALLPDDSELHKNLNVNQREAVRKVLTAKDYAIILGMPGTGKTTTIAEIINALVRRGKSVLLASYTHSAVDTILLKLKDADYPILRLGSLEKIHPDVQKFTLAAQDNPTTIEQLEHQIFGPQVVATTCLSVDHPVFARRYFDYCIVDEASQVTLPTCLGPLRYADKFVLVGDHFQLPPLIRSRDARAGGLDISLFRRLVEAHPQAVVELVHQYRMNNEIMLLANKLIYSDRLRCGSVAVANQSLSLPRPDALSSWCKVSCKTEKCWIAKLLNENCKAVFVDTDGMPAIESSVGSLIQNEMEATLVCQLTQALLHCGLPEKELGIISLYRQQVKLLSHFLHGHKKIEILTADRSQGRDKECIILSMVKSNESGQIGDLLKDWRRINVSFTRARSKLIIIGSRKTLCNAPILAEFFELVQSQDWILSLGPRAELVHQPLVTPNHPKTIKPISTSGTSKRKAPSENKENILVSPLQKKTKKPKVDQGILRGRGMLRDVVNDVS